MEQGPEEVGDGADERAEELERLTDAPLDESGGEPRDGNGDPASSNDDAQRIDPGL